MFLACSNQKGCVLFDISSLAEPVSEQSPCGVDLEYDGDFLALSQAVVGKPEQQFGKKVIPAVEPEWRAAEQMATKLLGRTKDIRVVDWLILAATHIHGVAGFASGVDLMLKLCERYWDDVHPRMIIDGEEDTYLRINAISAISDGGGGYSEGSGIMRSLRASLLVSQPLQVTVRDVELGVSKDPSARHTETQITSILSDAVKANAEGIVAFEQAKLSIAALDALIDERFGSGEQPDISALKALIKAVGGAIDRVRPATQDPSAVDGPDNVVSEQTGGAGHPVPQAGIGEIRSREDVRRALQRACEYLERNEPSNPAALFARRAEGMLDRTFLDIIQELSPDSVRNLQVITGAKLPGG